MQATISTSKILRDLQVNYSITDFDLANIPSSGAAVIVANQARGFLDIISILDVILKIRSDVKLLGSKVKKKTLKQYTINNEQQACDFINNNGLLIVFTRKSNIKFIHYLNTTVIPMRVDSSFSLVAFDKIQRKTKRININIGTAITLKMREELNLEQFNSFLQTNIICLKTKVKRKTVKKAQKQQGKELIKSVDRQELLEEISTLSQESLLFKNGDYHVYISHPSRITSMMREIGRERERTFRNIGEGTMQSIDTDKYDKYYHQLFIWDSVNNVLVGAYRLGLGDKIMQRHGLKGFYTNSLFKMKKPMRGIMEKSIELGRSFIVPEYQKKPASLLMLWKGIIAFMVSNKTYSKLVGPVTISGEFQTNSKVLLVEYLKKNHFDKKNSKHIVPLTGLPEMRFKINKSHIKNIKKIELINKIIYDIEKGELTAPVLFRKYIQLSSKVLAFNIDTEFCNALDALILLDYENIPKKTMEMLTK